MAQKHNVLMLGASYGSLLAAKLLLAGHNAKLVCLPAEVELINAEGAIVKMPVKGHEGLVDLKTIDMPGSMSAAGPNDIDLSEFDLAVLAMQEPQYRSAGVRELLEAIAEAGLPCMSIMNMPPLPYLKRIPGLDTSLCRGCYADATVWDKFDPALVTLCSPDPQAFRPPEEKVNVLQVRLPTNFKSARFESDAHTAILQRLESDIDSIRYNLNGEQVELPVKLRVHESIFVPMAKWCMLLAGNYRCVMAEEMRSIRDAVHADLDETKAVYDWVSDLCVSLGADAGDMVPFEKYAAAAQSLVSPSSAARALAAGAQKIERVDRLVKSLAARDGKSLETIDRTVDLVDSWLEKNREKAA